MSESTERPWIMLSGVDEAEIWVANINLEIKFYLEQPPNPVLGQSQGQGICLELLHGGKLVIHTTSEGMVLLDMSTEAEWIAPVITACSGTPAPRGQVWVLPEDTLIQLLLGLNSLIASTSIIMNHEFGLYQQSYLHS